MTDDAPTPSAHDQESSQRLVNDTKRKLDDLVASQKSARNYVTLATIVILIIVLGFGARAYLTARDNLSRDRLTQVANERTPVMLENLQRALRQTQERVLPAYQDEAVRRMGRIGPELIERTQAELVTMPDEIRAAIETQLNHVLENVRASVVANLQQKFPGMSKEDIVASLEQLKGYTAMEAQGLRDRLIQLQMEEAQRVEAVLVKFPVPDDVATIDKGELVKNLLKNALEYASYEVDVSGTDEGLDWGTVGDMSAWRIQD